MHATQVTIGNCRDSVRDVLKHATLLELLILLISEHALLFFVHSITEHIVPTYFDFFNRLHPINNLPYDKQNTPPHVVTLSVVQHT